MTWIYQGKPFYSKDIPKGAYGFIYLMVFPGGKLYIGRKQFYIPKTGRESDWKYYYGSSEITKKYGKTPEAYKCKREILHIQYNYIDNINAERALLKLYNVTRNDLCYNKIGSHGHRYWEEKLISEVPSIPKNNISVPDTKIISNAEIKYIDELDETIQFDKQVYEHETTYKQSTQQDIIENNLPFPELELYVGCRVAYTKRPEIEIGTVACIRKILNDSHYDLYRGYEIEIDNVRKPFLKRLYKFEEIYFIGGKIYATVFNAIKNEKDPVMEFSNPLVQWHFHETWTNILVKHH